jgi:glutamate transport system permease protein
MSSVLYDAPGPRTRRRMFLLSALGTLLVLAVVALAVLRLRDNGVFRSRQWEPFTDPGIQRLLAKALWATVKAALVAIVLALVLGVLLAAGRLSDHRWLRVPATVVVEFFRAVPLVLLILFLFLGFGDQLSFLGRVFGSQVPGAFGALVLGLTLYNGSVLAEVFRAGIGAVPRGQAEAAYALGMRKNQVMRMILVPQAARIMLPAIVSQCVVALKDTALGFVISYEELLRQGRLIYTNFGNIVPTLFVVAALYIAMCLALSSLASFLERRLRQRGSRVVGLDPAAEMGGGGAAIDIPVAVPTR